MAAQYRLPLEAQIWGFLAIAPQIMDRYQYISAA